jgi:hypothetical protein
MNTARGPRLGTDTNDGDAAIHRIHRLLDLTLEGAHANDRPDLIRRLTRVRHEASTTATADPDIIHAAACEALRALDTLEADLRVRRALLSDPARTARLRAELADAQQRYDRFTTHAQRCQHLLGDGFAAISAEVDFQLRARSRAVFSEIERDINDGDPAKDHGEINRRLRDRLVTEAASVYQLLAGGVARLAADIACQLERPATHRAARMPVTPPRRLVDDLPAPQPPTRDHTPVPARLLALMMPG